MRSYYVIKVDYYMYDAEKDLEFTSPVYLYTTRDSKKLFVFDESLNYLHHDLKWFATEDEAQRYIEERGWLEPQCSFENARVEVVTY